MSENIKRRNFLKLIGAASVAAVVPGGFAQAVFPGKDKSNKSPNFVFFLVDDMGWTDAKCFGSRFYDTPNIDRLASQGMKFTDAYAACPVCSPTRASIMTGKYPARLDTTDYFGAAQPENWKRNTPMLPAAYLENLPLGEVTIAEALKSEGYATFFAGKWHLGEEGHWPEDQGFDVNKGGWTRGGPYGGKQYFSPYGNPRLEDGPDGEHLPDRLASEACQFMEAKKAESFLTYLSFYSVHTPLISREDLKNKYLAKKKTLGDTGPLFGDEGARKVRLVQEHAVYGGMIEAMDMAVGKVLDKIEKLGIADNTVVFFMSDNGGLSTSEGSPTSNLPLRGGKGWMYEGGIREPMIVKWPGVTKPGSSCDVPVISNDFYPTMLDIAGVGRWSRNKVDGQSLVSLLKGGKKLNRKAIYWHYPHYGNQGGSPGSAVRAGDWKLIKFYEDGRFELYNLKEDIGEKNNLVDQLPKKTAELKAMLYKWLESVDAKMPSPNPAYKKCSNRHLSWRLLVISR